MVPYSYMWRMKVGAKFWPALRMPKGTWARSRPRTGWAARAPVPPIRKSEYPFMERKSATVLHMPASMAPMARPIKASVDEPPPNTSM